MPTVDDYLSLVPRQHAGQPDFMATLALLLQPYVDAQAVLATMPAAFDLDLATGAQLDAVGLWIGRSRYIETPLAGVFLSFDTPGLGWQEGYWRGPFDSLLGLTALPDEPYRLLLRAKIRANTWDGTMLAAETAITSLFRDGQRVFIQDNGDMSESYAVSEMKLGVVDYALFSGGYLSLKPAGVRIKAIVQTSKAGAPIFGFDSDNCYVAGFGIGAWASATANPY